MYRRYDRRVLAYALRRAPVEQAKDAAADAFLAAWRRFDELPTDPLPWLLGATRKTLATQRRAAERQVAVTNRLAHESVAEAVPGDAPAATGVSTLRAALARLGDADREALVLVAWDDLSPSQAAAVVGCSAVAFRVRLHRARRRFTASLARESRRL